MAKLCVENVPKELYEALRGRARARCRFIAAEVLALLEESIPTARELKATAPAAVRHLRPHTVAWRCPLAARPTSFDPAEHPCIAS